MEKLIFIGGIFPEHRIEEIQKTENITRVLSADTLQKNIIKGIEENTGTHMPVFSTYFLRDRADVFEWVKSYTWEDADGGVNYNLPYLRVKMLSLFSKYRSVKKYVSRWIKENNPNGKTKIIVYPAYFPFLMALSDMKKKYDIEVCMVVADLPQYMGLQAKKSLYNKLALKMTMYLFEKNLSVVDSFVLLTEQMNAVVNKENKPYTVMEGIASDLYVYKDLPKLVHPRVVTYSGGMQLKYGIPVLLDAIKQIDDQDVEFRFYGRGDAAALVQARAKEDSRIRYYESLEINALHDVQQESTMLINPRQNSDVFTKYSFPSKNLEYLLSGRPTVAYMLDGIPEEYRDLFVVPASDSAGDLAKCIQGILALSDEEQQKIGQTARQYVLDNKNYLVQTEKILKLFLSK